MAVDLEYVDLLCFWVVGGGCGVVVGWFVCGVVQDCLDVGY